MIKSYSLRLLENALNLAMTLDETLPGQLEKFEAKVVQMTLTPFQWSFFMSFSKGKLVLMPTYKGQPDTVISSTPLGLIRLSFLPASKARSLFHDGVHIEGDVMLGQALKRTMDRIDIDWEGHLARFTGDMVAYQLGKGVRDMKRRVNLMQETATCQLKSYLKEDSTPLPTREAILDFCDDVDQLVLAYERLEAKMKAMIHEVN